MSARVFTLLGAMVALGAAGSILFENGNGNSAAGQSAGDSWREPAAPINYFNSGDRFLSALSTGRLFPNTQARISAAEAALGIPLLEVYSPIRELWSGEIIAVAEFYERADQLEMDLAKARRTSWLVVGSAFLASTVVLFCIVASILQSTNLESFQQSTTTVSALC